MAKPQDVVVVTSEGPPHITWRTPQLAELAIARVPELLEVKQPGIANPGFAYDFLVLASNTVPVYIVAKGYSSRRCRIEPDFVPVLGWKADAEFLIATAKSHDPVILFLFDADRDHGRYLRLDTLPEPPRGEETVVLSFPVENTITGDSIRALAAELAKERAVPVAG